MSPVLTPLPLADAVRAEDRFLVALRHREDRPRLAFAAAAAVAAHALLLALPLPRVVAAFPKPPARSEGTPILRWLPSPDLSDRAPAVVEPEPEPLPTPAPRGPAEDVAGAARSFPIPRWALEPVREPPPPVALRELPPDAVTLLVAPGEEEGIAATLPRPLEVVRPIVIPESRVEPEFPTAAVAIRARGTVVLEVSVRADGTVAGVRAIESTRPGVGFEAAAVEAVRRWRFRPGRLGDEAVPATTVVRVDFR